MCAATDHLVGEVAEPPLDLLIHEEPVGVECSSNRGCLTSQALILLREQRSVDSLKVSARCGLSWNCRQIRPTVDVDKPLCCAIDDRDQWVAFLGNCSSVVTMTAST